MNHFHTLESAVPSYRIAYVVDSRVSNVQVTAGIGKLNQTVKFLACFRDL